MSQRRDPLQPPPRDALTVDVRIAGDVTYWCKRLRCTEHQLREAVKNVGPLPSNVEAFLRQRDFPLDSMHLPRGRRPS